MRALHLGLAFLLELAAFAAFAFWGADSFDGAGSVLGAMLAPAAAIALWAVFAAPRSRRRLRADPRLAFQFAVFGLAVAALVVTARPLAALVFGLVAAGNTALAILGGWWEE